MNKNELKKQKELLNKLKLTGISLSALLALGACGRKYMDGLTAETTTTATTEVTTEMTTEITTEMTTAATTEITTEVTTEYIEPDTEIEEIEIKEDPSNNNDNETTELYNDEEVLDAVHGYKGKIQEFYDEHNIDELGSKGKEYFITMVDFIFYDGEIRGIKFSDLKEETKEEVYREFCEMDELIMILAPNYKENISKKYEIVKDFTSNTYYKSLDKIKEYIGEERYDKIGELKDKAKDKLSETKDKTKEKIKDWYEDFRDGE